MATWRAPFVNVIAIATAVTILGALVGCGSERGAEVTTPIPTGTAVTYEPLPTESPTPTPTASTLHQTASLSSKDGYTMEVAFDIAINGVSLSTRHDKPGYATVQMDLTASVEVNNTTPGGREIPLPSSISGIAPQIVIYGVWPAQSGPCAIASGLCAIALVSVEFSDAIDPGLTSVTPFYGDCNVLTIDHSDCVAGIRSAKESSAAKAKTVLADLPPSVMIGGTLFSSNCVISDAIPRDYYKLWPVDKKCPAYTFSNNGTIINYG